MQNKYEHPNNAINELYKIRDVKQAEIDDLEFEISQAQTRLTTEQRQADPEYQKWQRQLVANSTGLDNYSVWLREQQQQADFERQAAPKTWQQQEAEALAKFIQLHGYNPREVGRPRLGDG